MKRIFRMLLAVLAVGLFSCNNDNVDTPSMEEELLEKSATIAVAEVQVEALTSESTYEVEFFANAEETLTRWWRVGKKLTATNKMRYKKQCPNVDIDGEDYPKTITLDYGEGTELKNGKILSGVIEIYISAPRDSSDYQRVVSYTNFGMDSISVNGTSTIEVDKVDSMFRQVSSDLTITIADGSQVDRTSERVWQWIAGMETEEDQTDDIIVITGNAEATLNGDVSTYTKEITSPLKRLGTCKYIVEGVVVVKLDGNVLSTVDYGDGTCDEIAEMTDSEGEVSEIDLSKRKAKKEQKKNKNGNNQNG